MDLSQIKMFRSIVRILLTINAKLKCAAELSPLRLIVTDWVHTAHRFRWEQILFSNVCARDFVTAAETCEWIHILWRWREINFTTKAKSFTVFLTSRKGVWGMAHQCRGWYVCWWCLSFIERDYKGHMRKCLSSLKPCTDPMRRHSFSEWMNLVQETEMQVRPPPGKKINTACDIRWLLAKCVSEEVSSWTGHSSEPSIIWKWSNDSILEKISWKVNSISEDQPPVLVKNVPTKW